MDQRANPTFTCSSCRSPFDWAPLVYHRLDFCCAGCAAGGPCCCSYDGHGIEQPWDGNLPMVFGEWTRLCAEAERLERQLSISIESSHREFGAPVDGAAPIPLWDIERKQHRLAQLGGVLGRARVEEPGKLPLIGARLSLRDAAGKTDDYWLVAPGEGDAMRHRVPADSPFGRLLLSARLGSSFAIKIPGGAQRVTLVAIAYAGDGFASKPISEAVAIRAGAGLQR